MCDFFSFITLNGDKYYFNWKQRKNRKFDECDSHSEIVKHYKLTDESINCYEYYPLTELLKIDCQHGKDDSAEVQTWCDSLDWKKIVEPLIIRPMINPFWLPKVERVTEEQIEWIKEWASVWASVRASVGASVGASVWASVEASVWASVWDSAWVSAWASIGASVGASVGDSVWASVEAYISTFINIEYEYDFSPGIKLWEAGLVPSFDGTTWRLHSGKETDTVYEWKPENEE